MNWSPFTVLVLQKHNHSYSQSDQHYIHSALFVAKPANTK